MELLQIQHFGKTLRLEASMAGWQQLIWGDQVVSQITASEFAQGKKAINLNYYSSVDLKKIEKLNAI